jgi:hypothetical protein
MPNQRYQKLSRIKRTAFFIIKFSLIILTKLSTMQFRLAFKDKGRKSLAILLFSNTFDLRNYNFLR